jgi:hypothetical protein
MSLPQTGQRFGVPSGVRDEIRIIRGVANVFLADKMSPSTVS